MQLTIVVRQLKCMVVVGALGICLPPRANAQFSIFESLFERVTDVSFYVGSNLTSDVLRDHALNISQFGMEVLYTIGARTVPIASQPRDSVRWVWTQTEVRRTDGQVDTVYHYTMAARPSPSDTVVTVELGLGYGQISGVEFAAEDMMVQGTVREFPAASIYVSHVPTSVYVGLRSGLVEARDLHAYDASGTTTRASPTSFQFGGMLGYAPAFESFFPFVELGWVLREFGSVDWEGDVVDPVLPRRIDLSGWQVVVGVQVNLGN
jgi:hypothetical protein